MRATFTTYSLIGIKADPVDVVVDDDRAKVIEAETSRCLHPVRLESSESEGSVLGHVVNARTSPLRKAALQRD